MNNFKRLGVALGAGVLAFGGISAVAPTDANAVTMKVKNHSTTRHLNVKDNAGSYTIGPGSTRAMRTGGRQILIPTGWILTKDSITWRSACNGHPSYWQKFSWQATTMDIRWVRCRNP